MISCRRTVLAMSGGRDGRSCSPCSRSGWNPRPKRAGRFGKPDDVKSGGGGGREVLFLGHTTSG